MSHRKRIGTYGKHTYLNQRLSVSFLALTLALLMASVHAQDEEFGDYEGFET